MPKRLIAEAPRKPAYQDYDERELGPKDVRVRAQFGCFKHGTEMVSYRDWSPAKDARYDSEWQMFVEADNSGRFPTALGNMIVGEVVETGSEVTCLKVGDRVTAHSGLKESVDWPATRVRVLPDSMSWQAAMCFDPLCFAVSAVQDGKVKLGDHVAVFGMGAIGLMTAQCARLQGAATVIVVEPIEIRRKLALAYGADHAIDPTGTDAGAEIRRLTGKKGVDVAIEVSGNYLALNHSIRGVAYGGNVVAVAYPPPYPAGVDFGREAHLNRPTLIFARGCSEPNREHPRWTWKRLEEVSWEMLVQGKFKTDEILNPVVPFEKAAEAWEAVNQDPSSSIKLGVTF